MTVAYDQSYRSQNMAAATLEEKFEVIKEVGDGSFGSVVLARTRTAGSHIARRGTMIAIKTMKKSFDSFSACLELREVIFLRTLPNHPHLVPALDIFLDPLSKKLHICMEYMDGNLYQLMKAREQKYLDGKSVKSILFQILSGLDHIHAHNFFHRDIKPENILVTSSAPGDSSTFSRYSSLVTPPSTPPMYTVKIADFGLARETHSSVPYTTYVSTRWYRAPEVLLRAGEYSAPVDMWAIGAMAVEIATLKPLFPGRNEVDQVWRVCEIMGSPGNWYSKTGAKVGGGEWRDGIRLAQKLGFSFPKMAPHSMESILQTPQWPVPLSNFVTWCLMWDPKSRPTSTQALNHEYFTDAVDPLRPKSSTPRLLGRKQSDKSFKSMPSDSPNLSTKPSWFRRSLIGRDSPAPVLEHENGVRPPVVSYQTDVQATKAKPSASKRATWTNGAPMPILPSIRPVSPLSNTVNAQANSRVTHATENGTLNPPTDPSKLGGKKIGRQLSVNSNGNHYSDIHRQEAERALNGGSTSNPPSATKEGFFSHLRKRARRLSGRNQITAPTDDVEANAGCMPWSNRSSVALDNVNIVEAEPKADLGDLDKALQNVRYSLDMSQTLNNSSQSPCPSATNSLSKRQSMPQAPVLRSTESYNSIGSNPTPISNRTRRALQLSTHPVHRYETPEEEDELLHEVLHSTTSAARRLGQRTISTDESSSEYLLEKKKGQSIRPVDTTPVRNPYPTPSPSSKHEANPFGMDLSTPSRPLNLNEPLSEKEEPARQWATPPYDEGQWASSAAASIFAASSTFR
ncbi:CMGC/RCK/MAK protein kinase [Polytolypa hystricis UAMH7299]|uniref:CMGC/RCK/MAK protein kinase n=1 Tax=Polytolypa hystricis (strain UAMH7299) TaxID=1447883 RepID=A0A2B7XHW3_POLH7|nr:CMGC/RCK/MAK protein kinase [Polytolypa hystricis UAMH7299]